jgi:hypothetical protein
MGKFDRAARSPEGARHRNPVLEAKDGTPTEGVVDPTSRARLPKPAGGSKTFGWPAPPIPARAPRNSHRGEA